MHAKHSGNVYQSHCAMPPSHRCCETMQQLNVAWRSFCLHCRIKRSRLWPHHMAIHNRACCHNFVTLRTTTRPCVYEWQPKHLAAVTLRKALRHDHSITTRIGRAFSIRRRTERYPAGTHSLFALRALILTIISIARRSLLRLCASIASFSWNVRNHRSSIITDGGKEWSFF